MASREVNSRWQRDMASYFLNLPGAAADEAMMPIEEVFHLD